MLNSHKFGILAVWNVYEINPLFEHSMSNMSSDNDDVRLIVHDKLI